MSASKHALAEWEDWEILRTFLPPGWREQARRLGAMRRARYISDPATVLRVLLLHLASGCSLAETAARASASGLAQISAVGVFKRLRAAEPWVRWLAQQMRGAADFPMAVAGRRVRAIDATSVSEPGSTGTDGKVHWAVNLADLQCDFFELTDVHEGGETFRRVPTSSHDWREPAFQGSRLSGSGRDCEPANQFRADPPAVWRVTREKLMPGFLHFCQMYSGAIGRISRRWCS